MTDRPDNQPDGAKPSKPAPPLLHPQYVPAQTDSVLTIRFVGNTAVVGGIGFGGTPGVDPYQMLAASEELKRKAFQFLQAAEVEEAKERQRLEALGKIETATKLPPGAFRRAGG